MNINILRHSYGLHRSGLSSLGATYWDEVVRLPYRSIASSRRYSLISCYSFYYSQHPTDYAVNSIRNDEMTTLISSNPTARPVSLLSNPLFTHPTPIITFLMDHVYI